MGLVELLDAIESDLEDMESTLDQECEYEDEQETSVSVCVNGGYDQEHTVTLTVYPNISPIQLMGGEIPEEIGSIKTMIGEMRQLVAEPTLSEDTDSKVLAGALLARIRKECSESISGSTSFSNWPGNYKDALENLLSMEPAVNLEKKVVELQETVAALQSEPPAVDEREPWANALGNQPDAWLYPFRFKPPSGYEWAMQYRVPAVGEYYINSGGAVRISKGNVNAIRPILIVNESGDVIFPPGRYPWPGTEIAKFRSSAFEGFAEMHDAPTGWKWAGEWRKPLLNEYFLNDSGHVQHAGVIPPGQRHILFHVDDPNPPFMSHKDVPAAPLPELAAAF